MAYVFKKENTKPVPIEHVEDEHLEERDYLPSFWWNNRRYFPEEDFEPVRRTGYDEIPENITMVESNNWTDPMYLEFPDKEHVNIYKEERGK